jgi:hypothetical protein
VKITIVADVGPTLITADPVDPGLEYKVYLNNDAGCAGGTERARTFDSLAKDSVVYVLLANTRYQAGSRVQFTVSVGPPPP